MAFEPQNVLEKSLVKAAADPAHRPQFYRDLVASDLFVIEHGDRSMTGGHRVLEEGMGLQIVNIEWEGRPYIPVFTSLPRLEAMIGEKSSYIAINALEFMKITLGAELMLNPGADYGKALTKEEIASIVDGSLWRSNESYTVGKATTITIGQPANYPTRLVEALSRYFKGTKQVQRAYLAHFMNPEHDETPHTLIGVEVSSDWDSVIAGAGMIARDIEVPDPPIDFVQITGRGGVDDYFINQCTPFYIKKKLFGIL